MRPRTAVVLLVLLAGCVGPGSRSFPPQYRAWCKSERKPLGPWTWERAEAERRIREHEDLRPHDITWLRVWRGDPVHTGLADQRGTDAGSEGSLPQSSSVASP